MSCIIYACDELYECVLGCGMSEIGNWVMLSGC